MRSKRVWGYWAHECLVGYQRWDPDPIKFANVMYTGFFRVMVGLFETLNDRRFSRPGALSLRWSEDTEYVYEFSSLCEAIVHNMDISSQGPQQPHGDQWKSLGGSGEHHQGDCSDHPDSTVRMMCTVPWLVKFP